MVKQLYSQMRRVDESQRGISFLGWNTYGTLTVPLLHDSFVKLGGADRVLAVGIVNVEHQQFHGWKAAPGICNLSSTPEMYEKARAHSQVRDPDESRRRMDRSLAQYLTNEVVQTYGKYQAHGVIVVSDDLDHLPALASTLRGMKARLQQHSLVVNTAIPEPDQYHLEEQRTTILAALRRLQELQEQGVIEATILTHLRSPMYQIVGKNPHLKLIAVSLASLIVGSYQRLCNPTFPQVIHRSAALSPFIGLAAGSVKIATGQPVHKLSLWQKLFGAPSTTHGYGDINDAIAQSKRLTHEVLEEEQQLISYFSVDLNQPFYEVYTVPFTLTDTRFEEFEDVVSAYLGREYPKGVFLAVSGNGASNGLGPGYYCQTSTFYPLQPHLFTQLGYGAKQIGEGEKDE